MALFLREPRRDYIGGGTEFMDGSVYRPQQGLWFVISHGFLGEKLVSMGWEPSRFFGGGAPEPPHFCAGENSKPGSLGERNSKSTIGFPVSKHLPSFTYQVRVNCHLPTIIYYHLPPFSPPVRWGLLDFMSACSPLPPPSLPPPSPPRRPPRPSLCEFSVACQTSTAIVWVQCGVPDLSRDPVSSVWRPGPQPQSCEFSELAGPQPRSCEFSVACRTSTAILWVQCGVPDLNRECVSSVWRAGPQPRSCEFSVACRASTAILSSVWRAGPQPRSCEFSVACRTSTASVWVQCGVWVH